MAHVGREADHLIDFSITSILLFRRRFFSSLFSNLELPSLYSHLPRALNCWLAYHYDGNLPSYLAPQNSCVSLLELRIRI